MNLVNKSEDKINEDETLYFHDACSAFADKWQIAGSGG